LQAPFDTSRKAILLIATRLGREPAWLPCRRLFAHALSGSAARVRRRPEGCQPRRIAINRSPKQRTAPAIVTAVDGSRNAAPITTTAAYGHEICKPTAPSVGFAFQVMKKISSFGCALE
jgi:hypothetical protein